jgi:hypothetical protein
MSIQNSEKKKKEKKRESQTWCLYGVINFVYYQVWKNTINNSWFLFRLLSHKQIPRNLVTILQIFCILEKKDVYWKKSPIHLSSPIH